jgi:octaprenyl-diphosphate synthase
MNLKDIYLPIQKNLDEVEREVNRSLKREDPLQGDIYEHILLRPGKKIRPALVLFSAGINDSRITTLAAAAEMIHLATLIHDDVIDEATLRRNQATLNKKWGNETAVLTGDNLFASAFFILTGGVGPEVIRILSRAAERMCAGEMGQIRHKFDLRLKEKDYLKIIAEKTGALMAACCQAGALLGGKDNKTMEILERYGLNFGTAFQIVDDCLDLTGEEGKLGKSLGSDIRKGKLTLPLIYFLEKSKPALKSFNELREAWLSSKDGPREKSISDSLEKAREYIIRAQEEVKTVEEPFIRERLLALGDYLWKKGKPQ